MISIHTPNQIKITVSPSTNVAARRRRSHRCAAAVAGATAFQASSSPYDVLGITYGASGGEIKAAYRRLARACHPDAVAADRKSTSADEFMRLHDAYETLSDPHKKAEYDRLVTSVTVSSVATGEGWRSPTTTYSRFSGGGRRSWETDQCW